MVLVAEAAGDLGDLARAVDRLRDGKAIRICSRRAATERPVRVPLRYPALSFDPTRYHSVTVILTGFASIVPISRLKIGNPRPYLIGIGL